MRYGLSCARFYTLKNLPPVSQFQRILFALLWTFIFVIPAPGQDGIKVKSVEFFGNESFSARELLAWLGLKTGSPYSEDVLRTAVSSLTARYREEGFYSALVESLSTKLVDDNTRVELAIYLREGARTELGAIEMQGNTVLSHERILSLFETRVGAPLRQAQLERDINALLQEYGEIGYPFAEVKIESLGTYLENGEPKLKLVLAVHEGDLIKIEEVKVEGNKDTKSNVIFRELRIRPGEPYSQAKTRTLRKRIERLGFFSSVSDPELYVSPKGGGLLIKVQEGNTNNFDGVLGYVPKRAEGPSGYFTGLVNLSLRNLFGTGRRFAVRWQREDQSSQEVELRYLEPWVLNVPINVGVSFLQREQDSSYVRRRVELKGDLMLSDDFSLSLLIGQDRIIPAATEGTQVLSRSSSTLIGGEVRYDSRDDYYSPTRGLFYRTDYRIGRKRLSGGAGTPDASEESFLVKRLGTDLEFYFQPITRQVVAIGFHASDLRSDHIEDGDFYRFGGANTLRGYRENQFAGSTIAWSNLEYRFLMARRSYFYGFTDLGYYFRPGDERKHLASVDAFKMGYGLGLRVETSLGLIGVSFALGQGDTFSTGKIHLGLLNQF